MDRLVSAPLPPQPLPAGDSGLRSNCELAPKGLSPSGEAGLQGLMPTSTAPSSSLAWPARARAIQLVLTDCDGVLTDGGVYYSESGESMKRFSIRDGMGVERLRNAGIATAIVTGERSPSVQHRADKLGIRAHLGVKNKAAELDKILLEHGFDSSQAAYIGDDVNDLAAMEQIHLAGLTGAPGDAVPEIRKRAHLVTQALGGHGAFREFAEWILALRADDASRDQSEPREKTQ